MADIQVKLFQVRRSYTAGYRPPTTGTTALKAGETLRNYADKIDLLGVGDGTWLETPIGDAIARKNASGQVLGDASAMTVTETGGSSKGMAAAIAAKFNKAGGSFDGPISVGTDLVGHAGNFVTKQDGTRVYAVNYGVVPNTIANQTPAILAAIQAVASASGDGGVGGVVVLPKGKIYINSTVAMTAAQQNIILEGAGQWATLIVAMTTFRTGDMIQIAGNYSGVRNLGFAAQPTAAEAAATPGTAASYVFRTGGYTVNLQGAFQFVERCAIRNHFIGVRMGATAGTCDLADTNFADGANDAAASGCGGILVDNAQYGPNNRIQNVILYGDRNNAASPRPKFGIQIANSGATLIDTCDILGNKTNLLINPASGKTAQATFVLNTYFDGSQEDCVLIKPTGTGFVFSTRFTQSWLSHVRVGNANGLTIDATSATGNNNRPILDTRFIGGYIIAVVDSGYPAARSGVTILGTGAVDTLISGNLITGWTSGVVVNSDVSHVTISDNSIGRYNMFGDGTLTNVTGIAMGGGSTSSYIDVHNNRVFGNGSSIAYGAFTGTDLTTVNVTNNPGYNGKIPAANITVPASGTAVTNGPEPATYYVNGGSAVSAVAPLGNVALASSAPFSINLGPGEKFNISYTSAPTIARFPH